MAVANLGRKEDLFVTGRGKSKAVKRKSNTAKAASQQYISRRELEERARQQADERKRQEEKEKRIRLLEWLIPTCVVVAVVLTLCITGVFSKNSDNVGLKGQTVSDGSKQDISGNDEAVLASATEDNNDIALASAMEDNNDIALASAMEDNNKAGLDSVSKENDNTPDVGAEKNASLGAEPVDKEVSSITATVASGQSVTSKPSKKDNGPAEKVIYTVCDLNGSELEDEYFFEEPVELSLSFDSVKNGTIYYTMDGTVPFEDESELYTAPIFLEASTDPKKPNIYVLRALAKDEDGNFCAESAHTFFVGTDVKKRYTTMIISIICNPKEITDEPDGILYGDNRFDRGKSTERRISTEFIYPDGEQLINQFAGVRVYGGGSRELPVVSLKLFAKKKYSPETGKFAFDLFETPTVYDESKIIKKYDKLVLRAGGDDFQRAMIRDELMMQLAHQAGFKEYEDAVASVTYINGEYYALNWIREYYCDDYFQSKFGKSAGEYLVLEGTERHKTVKGDDYNEDKIAMNFNNFYSKYCTMDLTVEENYKIVSDFLDVENYLRYYAIQLYGSNNDWPENNYRCYRYYAADGEEYEEGTERDGKWRFLLHDTDICFGTYEKERHATNDWANVTNPDNRHYSPLFTQLMKRADCREYFLSYTQMLIDSIMTEENVSAVLDELRAERDAEIPYYIDHMRELKAKGVPDVFMNQGEIDSQIERIKTFARLRGQYATQYLTELQESR